MTCHLIRRRRFIFLSLAMSAVLFCAAQAQDSAPSRPVEAHPNKSQSVTPRLRGGPYATPAYRATLPAVTNQEKAALRASNASSKVFKIGVGRTLPPAQQQIALEQITWTPLADGGYATLEVQSTGAQALRLAIDPRTLPRGMTLTVYGLAAPEAIYGPYTTDQLSTAGDTESVHWLPIVEGDTVRLELYADALTYASKRPLIIPMLSHLLASASSLEEKDLRDINASGTCNIDIACRVNWLTAGSSVAKYALTDSIGSTGVCTGTLLNTANIAGTPPAYFLTANHCVPTQQIASTLHLYWFFQRPTCGGRTPASVTETTGGATLLFTGQTNDTTLVQLVASPPAGTSYAAWTSASLTQGAPIVGLHHPAGDLKKYSGGSVQSFSEFLSSTNNGGASHIRVQWSEGTTEGGSSGSALFNSNGQVVGSLHGGYASCSTPSDSDWYGRFDQAYPSLQQWLAPTGGTPPAQPPIAPAVIDLSSGVAANGSVARNAVVWYRIVSTTAAGSLSVTLGGLSADADVFVHRNSMNVSPSCGSQLNGTATDSCGVNSPGNATWYIGVDGFQAASFTITATLSTASTSPPTISPTPGRSDGGGGVDLVLLVTLSILLMLRAWSARPLAVFTLAMTTIGCAGNGVTAAPGSDTTHQIVLPPPTKAELNAPRQTNKGQPLQIGFGRSLSAEQRRVPLARLRWGPLKSTGYLATVSVRSPGAKSLRIGAKLSSNVPGLQIAFRGAVAVASVVPGSALFSSEQYWSPVIDGDTIWIELRATAPIQDGTLLELPTLSHLP